MQPGEKDTTTRAAKLERTNDHAARTATDDVTRCAIDDAWVVVAAAAAATSGLPSYQVHHK